MLKKEKVPPYVNCTHKHYESPIFQWTPDLAHMITSYIYVNPHIEIVILQHHIVLGRISQEIRSSGD
jgi:hypothetical protein